MDEFSHSERKPRTSNVMESILKDLTAKNADLKQIIIGYRVQIATKEDELDQQNKLIKELEEKNKTVTDSENELKQRVEELEKTVEEQKKDASDKQTQHTAQISAKETEHKNLLSNKEKELQQAKLEASSKQQATEQQLAQSKKQVEDLQKSKKAVESMLELRSAQNDNQKQTIKKKNEEFKDYKKKTSCLLTLEYFYNQQLQQKDEEIERLEESLEALKSDASISNSTGKIEQADHDFALRKKDEEIAELRKEKEKMAQALTDAMLRQKEEPGSTGLLQDCRELEKKIEGSLKQIAELDVVLKDGHNDQTLALERKDEFKTRTIELSEQVKKLESALKKQNNRNNQLINFDKKFPVKLQRFKNFYERLEEQKSALEIQVMLAVKNRPFNFEINITLTVEKILRATFANPDRRKFVQNLGPWGKYQLSPATIDFEALIQRIASEIPNSLRKFNEQRIKLHDTSRIKSDVDKTKWIVDLKNLKWYGPFQSGTNCYVIQTATDSGNFEGLYLIFYFVPDKKSNSNIYLYYLNKNSKDCGNLYVFNNI